MSEAPGLGVIGGKKLRSTLRKAGADMKELKEVHKKISGIVIRETTAPYRDGYLDASIRPGATKATAIVRAGNNRQGKTAVPYANPIHWGWPRRHIKANPFLSIAAQRSEPTWFIVYTREIENIINRIKGA